MKLCHVILILSTILCIPIVYGCIRIPDGSVAEKSPADGRYVLQINGNPQNYEPGQKYNVSLKGIQAIPSPAHTFIGFMLAAENENTNSRDNVDFTAAGIFELIDYHETRFSDKCPNLVTHTNTLSKSKIQVIWVAPPAGSGCVNIRATVIEHRDVWYMDDGLLTKQFCEEQQDDINNQPPILEKCCTCDEAKYELTFEGKWSRHTHPKDFPANSWRTRFSDIIGASHTIDYRFWKYGELASEGLRELAEHGSTRKLESELKDQSDEIRTIIKARGIAYPNVTGKTFAVFRVDAQHHLISLVSMIDPSPDWIVGVSGLELCLPNCSWVEYKEHNLYPWDAGTDSGPSYMSADQPQLPPDVIRRIKSNFPNDQRSPFHDPSGISMKPLAKIYLSRRRVYEKQCSNQNAESDQIECSTHPWGKWTECNSRCGPGKSFRTRSFKNPVLAARMKCSQRLRDENNCVGKRCNSPDTYGGGGVVDGIDDMYNRHSNQANNYAESPECALSEWSEWTECSNQCGKGHRTKSRNYLNKRARKKCQAFKAVKLQLMEDCTENRDCSGDINFQDIIQTDPVSDSDVPLGDLCYIGEWSDWSPCSATCGHGIKSRQRDVYPLNSDNQVEENNPCSHENRTESARCIDTDCTIPDFCYSEPEVGPCRNNTSNFWYYSYQSDNCGIFVAGDCQQIDNKFNSQLQCESTCKPGKEMPKFLTSESLVIERTDCQVSDWRIHHCNVTCGEGHQIKTRRVLRMPRNGGKPCPKKLVRVDKCFVRCQDDYYSESFMRRTPIIENQYSNGVHGNNNNIDPICQYSEWSTWSPCTASCGVNSVRQKTRTSQNGNLTKCRDRVRVEKCNFIPCP